MSEMKPLLDESVSADAAKLLRSAEKDGPESPASAEVRTLAAIGLLSSAEIASSSSAGRVLGSFTRAGALSAFAAVVVFGAVVAVRSSSTAPVEPPRSSVEAAASEVVAPSAPAAVESVRVDDLPSVATNLDEHGAGKIAAPRSPAASRTPARPALEDELAAIDGARGALASGHPDVALRHVHDYRRTFGEGRFAEEAEALEIQALAALGRREEARAKGERFLGSHPGSPYEKRVRSSVASKEMKP